MIKVINLYFRHLKMNMKRCEMKCKMLINFCDKYFSSLVTISNRTLYINTLYFLSSMQSNKIQKSHYIFILAILKDTPTLNFYVH